MIPVILFEAEITYLFYLTLSLTPALFYYYCLFI